MIIERDDDGFFAGRRQQTDDGRRQDRSQLCGSLHADSLRALIFPVFKLYHSIKQITTVYIVFQARAAITIAYMGYCV